MRCSEARRLLVKEEAVGYGTARGRRLGRHLEVCGFCREEAAALEGEVRLLRMAFSALPLRPEFTREVLERLGAVRP